MECVAPFLPLHRAAQAAGSGQQYEAGVKADISQRMAELSKLGLDTSPGKAQPVPVHARLTLQHR